MASSLPCHLLSLLIERPTLHRGFVPQRVLEVREYLSGRFHDAFDRLLLLTIHTSKCFLQESKWHFLTIHASKDLDMKKCSGRSEDTYKKSIDNPSGHGDIMLILVV